ncbi:MAG TPA: hypothetical protein VG817_04715, partial [Gemmatimonadales bacterium]|nr:hypothetical protein [Gemmatimonadales bacterium]
ETSPDDAGIVQAIDRLSARLRERIGESLKTIREGVALARATTSSLEALRLYSEAMRLSANDEDTRAIPLLRQAVAIDTAFAMAWRKLAVALVGAGQWSEIADAARRAYRYRDRLTEVEAEATKAYYFANVVRDNARLEAAYRRMLELDPNNEFAVPNLAAFYTDQGQCAEAERLLREHPMEGVSGRYLLLTTLTCAGKFSQAREVLAQIAALTDSNSGPFLRARTIMQGVISPDSGVEAIRRLRAVTRDTARLYQIDQQLMMLEGARGRLQAADSHAARAAAFGAVISVPGTRLDLTVEYARLVLTTTGDSSAALARLRTALARDPLKSIEAEDWPAGEVATVYAMLGHVAEAKQVLADYERGTPQGFVETDPAYFHARALIALAENRPADAVVEIRRRQATGTVFDGNYELGLAFEKQGMTDSAIVHYEKAAARVGGLTRPIQDGRELAPSLRRVGELYEAKGDKAKALDAYGRLVSLWKNADPVLQPQVREVKERMAKLAGEPR